MLSALLYQSRSHISAHTRHSLQPVSHTLIPCPHLHPPALSHQSSTRSRARGTPLAVCVKTTTTRCCADCQSPFLALVCFCSLLLFVAAVARLVSLIAPSFGHRDVVSDTIDAVEFPERTIIENQFNQQSVARAQTQRAKKPTTDHHRRSG